MSLSRKDWEKELKATQAARDAMLKSYEINKRVADFMEEELKKFPKDDKDK